MSIEFSIDSTNVLRCYNNSSQVITFSYISKHAKLAQEQFTPIQLEIQENIHSIHGLIEILVIPIQYSVQFYMTCTNKFYKNVCTYNVNSIMVHPNIQQFTAVVQLEGLMK